MATDIHTLNDTHVADSETSVAGLIGGIMQDAQHLFVQQMNLFQVELKKDLKAASSAALRAIAGLIVGVSILIFLGLGVAYLLSWLMPGLPLWGALLIVGAALIPVSAGLLMSARITFESVTPLAGKSLEALKENVQWKPKS